MALIYAKSKYIRVSPYKIRQVAAIIKGKPIEYCIDTLKFMPQDSARIVNQTLKSAIANAENVHKVNVDFLIVSNVTADNGPSLKRFRARARGRGSRILKRTSHITVTLSDKKGKEENLGAKSSS